MNATLDIERFGAYQTLELIGVGSFAEVYRCYHADLDTEVAIKVLHRHLSRQEDVRARFLQEARILWRAEHPRVIPVHHVDVLPSGQPYFVMRLAERGSLRTLLEEQMLTGGPFDLRGVVGLGRELAECLEAVRFRGVVHRDLKPANVLVRRVRVPNLERGSRWGLTPDERLTLADFGLAKVLTEGSNALSQLGGTPYYMAPEQASLVANVDWRADLFAVGVMTFEMAVGEVPWPDRTFENARDLDLDLIDAHERSGGTMPAAFDDVIRHALMPDPDERFTSPEEFVDALTALVDEPEAVEPDRTISARVRVVARDVERTVGEEAAGTVGRVEEILSQPLRVVVMGGERTTPEGLTLRMLGYRTEPGRGAVLGHRVTIVRPDSELRLAGVKADGSIIEGRIEHDDERRLRFELPLAPWMVNSLEVGVPGDHFGNVEIVDVPWTVVRSDAPAAAAFVNRADIVVLGLPSASPVGEANLLTIVDLLHDRRDGPVGVVGVQAAASHENTPVRLPGTIAVLSSEDAAELRALTDDILGGDRAELLPASRAVSLLAGFAESDGGPVSEGLSAIRREAPDIDDLIAARLVVAERELPDTERLELLDLLARRAPQTRLGLPAGADEAAVRREATARRPRWEWARSRSGPSATRAAVLDAAVKSLVRLENLSEGDVT